MTDERDDSDANRRASEIIERLLRLGLLGRGRPLDESARLRMERMLGRSLPEVRLHDTEQAAALAQVVRARAFTVGAHIFALPGRLGLDTGEGVGLLAHELTHVSQQGGTAAGGSGATPSLSPGPGLTTAHGAPTGAAQPRGGARGPDVPPPSLQFASGDASVAATEVEREARAMERAARMASAGPNRRESGRGPDLEELADRVYRLMQEELWLHRERAAF